MTDFPGLRRALADDLDADAIRRVRRLFGLSRIGKPPTDDEVRQAIAGDRPASLEENLLGAVNKNVVYEGRNPYEYEEPEPLPLNTDALTNAIKRKLGIPIEENE